VRLITIETAYDVIPITPGVRPLDVVRETARIGIADDVEPLPRLLLAIMSTCQQSVDQPLVRIRRLIGQKFVDFGSRRRQAKKIERCAADKRALVGPVGEPRNASL